MPEDAARHAQTPPRPAESEDGRSSFHATLAELWDVASPETVLDVSHTEELLGERRPSARANVREPASLAFPDGEFDMVTAIDVLERLEDPDAALTEMARVARRWLLVAAPREPLWRLVNLARGARWRSLGREPAHRHRWSRVGFVSLLTRHGRVELIRSPVPWSMLLVRVD